MPPARSTSRRPLAAVILVLLAVVAVLWYTGHHDDARPSPSAVGASAGPTTSNATTGPTSRPRPTPQSGLPTVPASGLPEAARSMLVTIHAGGPYRYRQDGQTFGNREGILPKQPLGYYTEYTVKAGSQGDRGPLRIIRGRSGDLYWTSDHYSHFEQIKEGDQ